jgi:hypothetical protein
MTHPCNGHVVFTPARLAALKADWEAGLDAEEIAERLNALPGEYRVSSARSVRRKAFALGLKRSEGWRFTPRLWTPARQELLRNLINLIPDADVLERINALPGAAVKNTRAMRERAQRSGYLAERPQRSGPQPTVWTDERRAYLRENYGRIRPAELLDALQAMAGEPIASSKTVRNAARSLDIPSRGILRLPAKPKTLPAAKPRPTLAISTPEPAPRPLTAEEQDAIILEKLARIEAQAMKLFSRRESAATVSGSLKIPLREAFRLQAVHREQQKEAA